MGVMDFLKGLFSSKKEDQSLNDITASSSPEPSQEESQREVEDEKTDETGNINIQ